VTRNLQWSSIRGMTPQGQVTGGLEFVATGGVNGKSAPHNEEEIHVGCDW